MPSRRSSQNSARGKVIALEGDCDIISTHLNLLPPSQKILVLPAFQDYITKFIPKSEFEPKSFIWNIHNALIERLKAAHSFLETDSSPNHPKIVFMNGATIRARAICIEAICDNITAGQIRAAESIFNYLVRDGVASLLRQDKQVQEDFMPEDYVDKASESETELAEKKSDDKISNHEYMDMRSESKGLTSDQKFSIEKRIWSYDSSPKPVIPERMAKQRQFSEPFAIYSTSTTKSLSEGRFSARTDHNIKQYDQFSDKKISLKNSTASDEDKIIRTTFIVPSKEVLRARRRTTECQQRCPTPLNTTPSIPGAYLQDAEEELKDYNRSDCPNNSGSHPPTPTITVEKIPVNFTLSESSNEQRRNRPKTKFESRNKITSSLSSKSDPGLRKRPEFLRELNSSNFDSFASKDPKTHSLHYPLRKRTKDASTSPTMEEYNSKRSYVDKGCGVEEHLNEIDESNFDSNEPLFGLVEDLVVYFSDGEKDVIFDAVLNSYQQSKYPILQSLWPINPLTINMSSNMYDAPPTTGSGLSEDDEFHPETNLTLSNTKKSLLDPNAPPFSPIFAKKSPTLTPCLTPPLISPLIYRPNKKILTFSPKNANNIISIHNSFRRLLSNHLPTGEKGYSQFYQTIYADSNRLWKPVFGNWNVSECVLKKSPVDQIIAFGSDGSEEDDFKSRISGLIVRLGTKKSGDSRSCKLEISYLIIKALQNFNNSSSCQQAIDPFLKPSLIANLLVPQLESFFASNPTTHFLVLHYSSSQLPIVFALRELLGDSLFKISGITKCSSPTSPRRLSKPSSPISEKTNFNEYTGSCNGNPQTISRYVPSNFNASPATNHPPPTDREVDFEEAFSGADYILSNIAAEEEINCFISDIRKTLVEISNYYLPEPEPEPRTIVQVVEKFLPSSTPAYSISTKPSSQHTSIAEDAINQDRLHVNTNTRRVSKSTRQNTTSSLSSPLSEFISKRNYAASIASSRLTYASSISGDIDGWESFDIGDDDSDFDEYDRMILGSKMSGLVIRKPIYDSGDNKSSVAQKGMASKRKALKWLGLA